MPHWASFSCASATLVQRANAWGLLIFLKRSVELDVYELSKVKKYQCSRYDERTIRLKFTIFAIIRKCLAFSIGISCVRAEWRQSPGLWNGIMETWNVGNGEIAKLNTLRLFLLCFCGIRCVCFRKQKLCVPKNSNGTKSEPPSHGSGPFICLALSCMAHTHTIHHMAKAFLFPHFIPFHLSWLPQWKNCYCRSPKKKLERKRKKNNWRDSFCYNSQLNWATLPEFVEANGAGRREVKFEQETRALLLNAYMENIQIEQQKRRITHIAYLSLSYSTQRIRGNCALKCWPYSAHTIHD